MLIKKTFKPNLINPLLKTKKRKKEEKKKSEIKYIHAISGVEVEVGILNGGNRSTASSVSIGSDLSIGSWSTGLVSSLAGLKGGLRFGELLFGLVEDSEQRLLFIVFFVTNATPHCTIKVCLGRFRLVADASSSPPP